MKWINKQKEMPSAHEEYKDWTKEVLVTDGKNWGHGYYNNRISKWIYSFIGCHEWDSNNITHWMYVPELPK